LKLASRSLHLMTAVAAFIRPNLRTVALKGCGGATTEKGVAAAFFTPRRQRQHLRWGNGAPFTHEFSACNRPPID